MVTEMRIPQVNLLSFLHIVDWLNNTFIRTIEISVKKIRSLMVRGIKSNNYGCETWFTDEGRSNVLVVMEREMEWRLLGVSFLYHIDSQTFHLMSGVMNIVGATRGSKICWVRNVGADCWQPAGVASPRVVSVREKTAIRGSP